MMDKLKSRWQRHGGYIVLAVVGVFLMFALRRVSAETWWGERAAEPIAFVNPDSDTGALALATPGGEMAEAVSVPLDWDAVPVLDDTSLSPSLNPLTYQPRLPAHDFEMYVVKRGDTPNKIAEKFGIKAETLLGGNPSLSEEASLLQTDVELRILPTDGLLHTVRRGDTLESVSELYDIPVEDIIAYVPNNLAFPYRLYPDSEVLVPGAIRELFQWNPPTIAAVSRGSNSPEVGGGYATLVRGTGVFVWPVSGRNISQGYWYGHQAIDVALPEGGGVFASDTGTVTFARWSIYCYGNLIVINHGNGYETFYAHLSAINVYEGQVVTQGQVIGATGNTGCSSGPHIHFEIRLNQVRDQPCWFIGC